VILNELIGLRIHDVCGKYVGRISDLVFDLSNFNLKHVIVAKFFIKFLGLGLLRRVIPKDFISVLPNSKTVFILIPIEMLNALMSNAKYAYLRKLERSMLKCDIISLVLYIPTTLLLLLFGILLFFTIPGQIMLWTGTILALYLPILILETQYLDHHKKQLELSVRTLYKRKVIDLRGNIIGVIRDLNVAFTKEVLTITSIKVLVTADVSMEPLKHGRENRVLMLPVNLVIGIKNGNIIVRKDLNNLLKQHFKSL